jgi:hypothetical protein
MRQKREHSGVMVIFAVRLETQARKRSDAPLRAIESAAFIHEDEDLVVFSPRLYKKERVDHYDPFPLHFLSA